MEMNKWPLNFDKKRVLKRKGIKVCYLQTISNSYLLLSTILKIFCCLHQYRVPERVQSPTILIIT